MFLDQTNATLLGGVCKSSNICKTIFEIFLESFANIFHEQAWELFPEVCVNFAIGLYYMRLSLSFPFKLNLNAVTTACYVVTGRLNVKMTDIQNVCVLYLFVDCEFLLFILLQNLSTGTYGLLRQRKLRKSDCATSI